MNKLWILTALALAATAVLAMERATAEEPTRSTCAVFALRNAYLWNHKTSEWEVSDPKRQVDHALPPGWTPVGGSGAVQHAVIACRPT